MWFNKFERWWNSYWALYANSCIKNSFFFLSHPLDHFVGVLFKRSIWLCSTVIVLMQFSTNQCRMSTILVNEAYSNGFFFDVCSLCVSDFILNNGHLRGKSLLFLLFVDSKLWHLYDSKLRLTECRLFM